MQYASCNTPLVPFRWRLSASDAQNLEQVVEKLDFCTTLLDPWALHCERSRTGARRCSASWKVAGCPAWVRLLPAWLPPEAALCRVRAAQVAEKQWLPRYFVVGWLRCSALGRCHDGRLASSCGCSGSPKQLWPVPTRSRPSCAAQACREKPYGQRLVMRCVLLPINALL